MDTADKEQAPAPAKKDIAHRVLMAMTAALGVFIVVCLSLTAYLVLRQGPAAPRPMVLRHPSNAMVPAGVTPADLETANELSQDWTSAYVKGLWGGGTPEAFVEGLSSIQDMLSSGRIVAIPNGTPCLLTDSGWRLCQVQITDGPLDGRRYWVHRSCLSRIRDTDVPDGLFCGFMCVSVYLQYVITAVICGAGIYALKLQSMFMQLVLFIIGMVALNLLWARIALLLMF
jgi:hypothetical protein